VEAKVWKVMIAEAEGRKKKRREKKQEEKEQKRKKERKNKKKPKKKKKMEVNKVVEEWEIWNEKEEIVKSEEGAKKLVPQ